MELIFSFYLRFVFTLLISSFFCWNANAQLGLKWATASGRSVVSFDVEPPSPQKINDLGTPYKALTITDSFGNIIFYVKNNSFNDSNNISIVHGASNKEVVIKKTYLDFPMSNPVVLKKKGSQHEYFIFWTGLYKYSDPDSGFDWFSDLNYVIYDANTGEISSPNVVVETKIFAGFGEYINDLKSVRYSDGSQYIAWNTLVVPDSSVRLYRVDTVVRLIGKWKSNPINRGIGLDNAYAMDFYHHQKSLLCFTSEGLSKLDFDQNQVLGEKSIPWPYPSLNNEVFYFELSPNDSMLYLLYVNTPTPDFELYRLFQYDLQTLILHKFSKDKEYFVLGLGSNGKIYSSSGMSISNPNLPWPKCGFLPDYSNNFPKNKSTYLNVNYIEPSDFVGFKCVPTCGDTLRLINQSDDLFVDFEWELQYVDRGTSYRSTKAYDRVLALPGEKIYVKLKGSAPNGHSLWFSDTIIFSPLSAPKLGDLAQTAFCALNEYHLEPKVTTDTISPFHGQDFSWIYNGAGYTNEKGSGQEIIINPSDTGSLKIQLRYTNGFCSIDSTYAVKIKPSPKPSFTLSDTFSCSPAEITFRATDSSAVSQREFSTSHGHFSNEKTWKITFDSAAWYHITQTLTGPNGCSSSVSRRLRVAEGFTEQDRGNLLTAMVLDSHRVLIKWISQPQGAGYLLSRSEPGKAETELFMMNPSQDFLIDTLAIQTNRQSYSYRLKLIDSCGHPSGISNMASTILLKQEENTKAYVIFRWNAYESWENGVQEYQIERSEDGLGWTALGSQSNLSYADKFLADIKADVYYRVKAVEKEGNQQSSYSNVLKVSRKTMLFIPNAFSPNGDGINDILKIGHIGLQDFECKIYSRSGQIVATSTDPDHLWDGKINEEYYPANSYRYVIKAVDFQGYEMKYMGSVNLLR